MKKNVERFSKTQQQMFNNAIMKDLTTPQTPRYTTLEKSVRKG